MSDWKKHLDVHQRDILDIVPTFDGTPDRKKEFIKKLREVVRAIKLQKGLRRGYYDEYEMAEMKRCLELCEALDEWRGGDFAGERTHRESIIHIPVKFSDLDLLFCAMDRDIDSELEEWTLKSMEKKRRR